MSGEQLVLCYNRGCGQEFKPSENTDQSCKFHPGEPFFHDAYKGWTCCNRKTVDFSEFLNMKGCTTHFHSNVKPPEPEKKEEIDLIIPEPEPVRAPVKSMARPSIDSPKVELEKVLSASLKSQVFANPVVQAEVDENKGEIKIGTACIKNGCKTVYEGPETNKTDCQYHPGSAVFHEGLKFWSCCVKRTTDFQVFLAQKGCVVDAQHAWTKPENCMETKEGKKVVQCRFDWHQTATHVTVAIYAKKFDPNQSFVRANAVALDVQLIFPEENGIFQENWILKGIIDPSMSKVSMTPTKLELTMKKAEAHHWSDLIMPKQTITIDQRKGEVLNVGVEPVDLSDL